MSARRPPGWARWIAARLIRGPEREFVLGDLEELYVATDGGGPAAVGLGIATLTWGVRYGSLGRDLPVSDPERVLSLRLVDERTQARADLCLQDVEAVREQVASVEAIGVWSLGSANLTDGTGPPLEVQTMETSAGLLDVFEITPLLGRSLVESDGAPGAPRVALLGYRYWQTRHGGDPAVVGSTMRLDGEPTLVVGVLTEGEGLTSYEDVWRPAGAYADPTAREFNVQLRVRPGTTRARLASELEGLAARLAGASPEEWSGRTLAAYEFSEGFYGGVESVRDRVLTIGGVLLFVMALANVANLFLVLVEASIPALIGFVGAAGLAAWTPAWYESASNEYGVGFVWQVFRLEVPHLSLIAAGTIVSTVVVSLAAATRELSGERGELLTSGRGQVGSGFRLGRALLGVEVTVGAALLLVAALMVRSGWNLLRVDYGFTTENVMTGDVTLRGTAYRDPAARLTFWERLQGELESIDGVRQAAVGTQLPMIRCCGNSARFEIEGRPSFDPSELPVHYVDAVGPTYFDTFEKPILSGRGVTTVDTPESDPVVIVNVHFANRYFPGETPIGRRVRLWRGESRAPGARSSASRPTYRREGPLFALLGAAALLLAVAGVYAVVSNMASLRVAEFGLRRALGATRPGLIARSVGGALLPTLVGSVVGLSIGLALTRGFDRFVFLVDPWSPAVAAATVAALLGSAGLASLLPALRASRVDPLDVLRSE